MQSLDWIMEKTISPEYEDGLIEQLKRHGYVVEVYKWQGPVGERSIGKEHIYVPAGFPKKDNEVKRFMTGIEFATEVYYAVRNVNQELIGEVHGILAFEKEAYREFSSILLRDMVSSIKESKYKILSKEELYLLESLAKSAGYKLGRVYIETNRESGISEAKIIGEIGHSRNGKIASVMAVLAEYDGKRIIKQIEIYEQ